jgi:hypothetical protein
MSYDSLSRDYSPKDPYSTPAEQQMRFHPDHHAKQMAQGQERIYAGAVPGASIEKVRSQGNVTREVQQFEKHLNALICVIDELDRRLATATIPAPETSNTLRGSDQSGSALANQLSSFNNMLSHQINRLEAIYQGVDL